MSADFFLIFQSHDKIEIYAMTELQRHATFIQIVGLR